MGLLVIGPGCVKSDVSTVEAAERSSALYRKARDAEQSGDIKEAIRLYNKVLVEEPKSFSAHFQLATLLHDHEENYVGAIYHYQQYLYLRPESEKSTLAQDRIRIAEQLLAPQILRKVGESVQGISQAHLLKENDRLNRVITGLEREKSVLVEAKALADKEVEKLRNDYARLHEVLNKMRVGETVAANPESLQKRLGTVKETEKPSEKLDAKALRALREEAQSLSTPPPKEVARKPLISVPSTEAVLKKVQAKLSGEPEAVPAPVKTQVQTSTPTPPPQHSPPTTPPPTPAPQPSLTQKKMPVEKQDKASLSSLALFGKEDKKEKAAKTGEQRTYVVQPGDTLFRVAEKFYGDSTHWKKIRDANRARIDPDGRIRAGQIIVVP
jgi:tetratricopeptide (TPR) repeat protein